MPEVKSNVPKVSAPSSNVGKVYGTYVTETEKKAAAANDWLLPKDKAAEAARATTSNAKSSVSKLTAPAAPAVGAVKAATGTVSSATSAVTSGATAAVGNVTGKAGDLAGNLTNKLQLPKVPSFPGMDKAGIMLGAGPKFISSTVTKYSAMVPSFVPGLTLNIGMVAGAIAAVKGLSSINPSQFLSQVTSNIAGDLKGQAGELLKTAEGASGLADIKNQVSGIQSAASGVVDSAKGTLAGVESSITDAVPNVGDISLSNVKTNLTTSATEQVSKVAGSVSKNIPSIG